MGREVLRSLLEISIRDVIYKYIYLCACMKVIFKKHLGLKQQQLFFFFSKRVHWSFECLPWRKAFPVGSDGKESACNAGDLGSIPDLGRSPGEGNGYPLQHTCLGNSMDRGAWQATVHGIAESDMTERLTLILFFWRNVYLDPLSIFNWFICLFIIKL